MKATKVIYEKTFNLGNYQNEVIGIEIELAEGEKASGAMDMAKRFVEAKHTAERDKELENARHIADNPFDYTYRAVTEANQTIARLADSDTDEDLPF